ASAAQRAHAACAGGAAEGEDSGDGVRRTARTHEGSKVMTDAQMYWSFYAFFLLIRIPANFKRCRIPLMRWPGYFFHTRVPAGFFEGPGRGILRRYRLWIFAPFLFDALALAAIYLWGRPVYLLYLALADTVIAMLNHMAALKRSIREAKEFEVEPVPASSG